MRALLAFVVGAVVGYTFCYYKIPQTIYGRLQDLTFQKSGFESDEPAAPTVVTTTHSRLRAITTSTNFAAVVTRVIDGDTIVIDTGQRVHYLGINAPELADQGETNDCFAADAAARNKDLVLGKTVRLVKDVSDKDEFGRLLRYVYYVDGTFVNLKLVEQGYARAEVVLPDEAQGEKFDAAEAAAQEKKLGLWSACAQN